MKFHIDIPENTPPVHSRVIPLNPNQEKDLERQLKDWIDADVKSIFSSSLSGFAQKTKIVSDLIGVEDLAVDWVHNIIYWTDTKRVAISACTTGNC